MAGRRRNSNRVPAGKFARLAAGLTVSVNPIALAIKTNQTAEDIKNRLYLLASRACTLDNAVIFNEYSIEPALRLTLM